MDDYTFRLTPHLRMTHLVLVLILSHLPLTAGDTPSLVELKPQSSLSVTALLNLPAWKNILVRDMKADANQIALLVSSKDEPSRFAIVQINASGGLRSFVDLSPSVSAASGLAVTSAGVAVFTIKDKKRLLSEYDAQGTLLRQLPVSCSYSGEMLVISGNPATICADGTITEFQQKGERRYNSWARPGTKVQLVSDDQLMIVDQATAQVALNNIGTNTLAVLPIRSAELDEARARTSAQVKAMQQQASVSGTQPGRPLVVMDTARDSSGWYLLIWPYHEAIGPAVLKLDGAGSVIGRFRCLVPSAKTPSLHILEAQNGYLVLASVRGDVFKYKP